ncbi:MAG TPA: hypothetical protein VD969_07140 [Symbiobacteriaceae bacterium]|nr:hypothetical protein [Symbiobacteriaceae bacterium]
MGSKRNARQELRSFVRQTLKNAQDLRDFSVREVAQAGRQVEQTFGGGTFRRWAVVFLIIFVLFFLLIPQLGDDEEDQS